MELVDIACQLSVLAHSSREGGDFHWSRCVQAKLGTVCLHRALFPYGAPFLPMVAFRFTTLPLQGTQSEFLLHPRGSC